MLRVRLPAYLGRCPWWSWVVAAVIAFSVLCIQYSLLALVTGHLPTSDLAVFREAGGTVWHGKSIFAPGFGTDLPTFGLGPQPTLPFTYPPFAALLFVPLAAVPLQVDGIVWNGVCIVALLVCICLAFRPLLERCGRYASLALGVITGLCFATDPVRWVFTLGQLGLGLMALCMLDCLVARPRWPRGVLVGIAAAMKLVPGLFVVYFLVTRRWREAVNAGLAFLVATVLSFAVMPHDAWKYWSKLIFETRRIGFPYYYSNQSLYGTMTRIGMRGGETVGWIALVAATLFVGYIGSTRAHLAGNELAAAAIVGVTGELVSPISWVHHIVWFVPALAVFARDLRPWRRALLPLGIVAWFSIQLPELGHRILKSVGPSHLVYFYEDFYCFGCVLLLGVLVLYALRLRAGAPAGAPAGAGAGAATAVSEEAAPAPAVGAGVLAGAGG